MRLAIVGSRWFTDYEFMKASIDLRGVTHIVSGGAPGADTLAERLAAEFGIEPIVYPIRKEDWRKYGLAAGPIRNTLIVNEGDAMVAFWDYHSNGTRDAIKQCRKAGKFVRIVDIRKQYENEFFS